MRRFVQAFASMDAFPARWPAAVRQAIADAPDHYNLGKGDDAWAVRRVDGALQAVRMRWGLVPRWSKTLDTPYTTVTARLERAARSRVFGGPWKSRRCLVPMAGYYKWDRTVRPPVPHFIQARDGAVLCAAGLWERWDKDGPAVESFAILTHPNASIPPPLTPDGPVFVSGAVASLWLDGPQALAGPALRMAAGPPLESYAVSNAHRDRSRSDYTLLEPRGASDPPASGSGDMGEEDEDEDD